MAASEEINKSSPLHKAAEYRNIHKIKILLSKTNINRQDEDGNTALHIACEQDNNEEIVDLLLSRNDINVTLKNRRGLTALHCLAFRGYLSGIIKILKKYPQINIDEEEENKNTPLIMASIMNHVDIIKYLVSKGANVKHTNKKDYTALHYAANNGCTEAVQALLDLGADVDAKDGYRLTPLMKACKWSFYDTSDILLKNGADVNYSRNYYLTPLTSACFNDSVEVAKLLISEGADVNFPGSFSSAFQECAKHGRIKCAKLLIEKGVLVFPKTKKIKNAIDFARERGHNEIVELIQNLE